MVFACRRKRILRIVAFIGVACVIFLCFQVFLVGFLDHDAHLGFRHGAQPKFGIDDGEQRVKEVSAGRTVTMQYRLQLQQKLESECSSHNCSIAANLLIHSLHAYPQNHVVSHTMRLRNRKFLHDSHKDSQVNLSHFESVWMFLEYKFARPVFLEKNVSEAHFTRGVSSRWQYLYKADDHMQFTCILSQVYP